MPPFLPRIARATVAGFDKIARAYRSVTRKQPHIRRRTGVFEQCVLILLLSSQFSPLRLLLLQCRCSTRAPFAAMGKEKTGGSGAREEGDGEGEGEKVQPGRILVVVRFAAWLDPGQLDPVDDQSG